MATPSFTGLTTVAVPVSDQDRAVRDFTALGFRTCFDQEVQPGFRWVDLEVPGGGTQLSIVKAGPELPAGVDTGIRFTTPDARAAHEAVAALGLQVGELLDWDTAPLMFSFVDRDGNRYYVVQDE